MEDGNGGSIAVLRARLGLAGDMATRSAQQGGTVLGCDVRGAECANARQLPALAALAEARPQERRAGEREKLLRDGVALPERVDTEISLEVELQSGRLRLRHQLLGSVHGDRVGRRALQVLQRLGGRQRTMAARFG